MLEATMLKFNHQVCLTKEQSLLAILPRIISKKDACSLFLVRFEPQALSSIASVTI